MELVSCKISVCLVRVHCCCSKNRDVVVRTHRLTDLPSSYSNWNRAKGVLNRVYLFYIILCDNKKYQKKKHNNKRVIKEIIRIKKPKYNMNNITDPSQLPPVYDILF